MFSLLAFAQLTWAAAYVGEVMSSDLPTMLTFVKIQYLGIVSSPILWLLFALIYSSNSHWITRRNVLGMMIIPGIVLASVWTIEHHDLHYASAWVDQSQGFPLLDFDIGLTYVLNLIYAEALLITATILIIKTALKSRMVQRRNGFVLVVTWIIIGLLNLLFVFGPSPTPGLDLTPMVFGVATLIIGGVVLDLGRLVGVPVAIDLVIHSMRSGIVVLDPEGNVVQINRPALEMLQYERRTILGRKFEIIRERHPLVFDVYESLTSSDLETEQRDEAILGRGEGGPHIEIGVNPLVNQSGYLVGQLVSLLDIEDLKRAQITAAKRYAELAALRYIDTRMTSTLDIEQVLDVALRSAVDMTGADAGFIALVEEDVHRVVHTIGTTARTVGDRLANERGTTGRVLRKRKSELIHDVYNDPSYLPSYSGVSSQIIIPLEVHDNLIGVLHLDSSKSDRFSEDNYGFAQTLGGRIAVAIENAQLYSKSRQQLEELQKLYEHVSTLEQTKTDMIRLASHDLRNPLGTILGYVDLMQLDRDDFSPRHQEYLDMMMNRMEQMQRIVNDILTLEKLESEGKSLTLRAVDLQSLVMKATETIIEGVEKKSLTLKRNLPTNSVMVWADPVQLFEAIRNLLDNAIKYTPAGGEIMVQLITDLENKKARFEVIDTGVGIPDDLQEHLFEPFYRANRTAIQTIEGTGLGLHLVKNIVERQHGSVHFSSKADEGSTFGFEVVLANR